MTDPIDTPTFSRLAVLKYILETVRIESKRLAVDANLYQHYGLRSPGAKSAYEKRIKCKAATEILEDLIALDSKAASKLKRETFIPSP
jgi:hypothetical protein